MLRYKTETRPGLVALYDIRPGNGAGPFLQPRSPHGAKGKLIGKCALCRCICAPVYYVVSADEDSSIYASAHFGQNSQ